MGYWRQPDISLSITAVGLVPGPQIWGEHSWAYMATPKCSRHKWIGKSPTGSPFPPAVQLLIAVTSIQFILKDYFNVGQACIRVYVRLCVCVCAGKRRTEWRQRLEDRRSRKIHLVSCPQDERALSIMRENNTHYHCRLAFSRYHHL